MDESIKWQMTKHFSKDSYLLLATHKINPSPYKRKRKKGIHQLSDIQCTIHVFLNSLSLISLKIGIKAKYYKCTVMSHF